jgi:hypothetical protein
VRNGFYIRLINSGNFAIDERKLVFGNREGDDSFFDTLRGDNRQKNKYNRLARNQKIIGFFAPYHPAFDDYNLFSNGF